MNILLLGGNAKMNKEWVDSIGAVLTNDFDEVVVQNYLHWEGEEGALIDINAEKGVQKGIVKNWKDYAVFAKSAGCIVTLSNLEELDVKPRLLVFVGFPYEWAKEQGIDVDRYLKDLSVPTLFVQKPLDWAMKYDDLVELVKGEGDGIKLVEYVREGEPTDDHHYADIEYLKSLILSFTNEN